MPIDPQVVNGGRWSTHYRRIPRNPAQSHAGRGRTSGLFKHEQPKAAHRYLSHADLQALAGACGSDQTLVLVLGYAGLRWGEAVSLRVDDVDVLRGRLRIDESLSDVNGELSFGPTKTHAVRYVPFPAFLREPIEAAMEGKGARDLLFTSAQGTPLRGNNWRRRVFLPALSMLGMERMRIHDLRHTGASLAVASGASIVAVQNMMGHAHTSTTLNVYTHLFDGHLDDLAESLNRDALRARADLLRTEGDGDHLRLVGGKS